MLNWWLIPLLVLLALVIWSFYVVVKHQGGSGVRQEGRTLVDKPDDENPPLE